MTESSRRYFLKSTAAGVTDLPKGKKVGCNNQASCSLGQSMYLQLSGDYLVHAYFRMDSGVNQRAVPSRRVHLLFVA